MMQKNLAELCMLHADLTGKAGEIKEWATLLSYWEIEHDMTEAIDTLNKLLTKSNILLKSNKPRYVRGFLDHAQGISSEIENHHIEKHQNQLFSATQTLFYEAKKTKSDSDLLKNIHNILEKEEKPTRLLESIDFYNKAINLIRQLIKNRQISLKKAPSQLIDDPTILSKIEDALNNPENYRSFCRPVKTKSIQHLINSAIHQNGNNLVLAIFGDKQFIEFFFTTLYGKPVSLNKTEDEQETVILWRLTLSKNTVVYILGITTDKLLKHPEQKWFKLLSDFHSVLVCLENCVPQSDKNSATLMALLNLIHHDTIHLIEPNLESEKDYNKPQHFLFQYLTHVHFGGKNDGQKISNWIIQSIFPYNRKSSASDTKDR